MKTNIVWTLLLWFVLVLENVRSDFVLSQSLLLPSVVGCLFWYRNGNGSVIAGTALILDWMLHPAFFPLTAAIVLLLATRLVTRSARQAAWSPTVSRRSKNVWWIHPLFVLVAGLACHATLISELQVAQAASMFLARLFPAFAALALLLFAFRAAEQFGWRKISPA